MRLIIGILFLVSVIGENLRQAVFVFITWSSDENRKPRSWSGLGFKAFWTVLSLALMTGVILFSVPFYEWCTQPLREWWPPLAVVALTGLFTFNLIYLTNGLKLLSTWGESAEGREFIRLLLFFQLGGTVLPVFMYFISFALLMRELDSQGLAIFRHGATDIGGWIRYAISAGVGAADSDIGNVLPKTWSAIVPVSRLALGADLFFKLFTKLIVLAAVIKLIVVFLRKGKEATPVIVSTAPTPQPPGQTARI